MGTVPTFSGAAVQADLAWWIQTRPFAYAYQTTAQTAVPASTWTPVSLQTNLIDRELGHSGSSGRYTVGLTNGVYLASGVVAFAGTGGTTRMARFVVNGTVVDGSVMSFPAAGPVTVPIPPVPVESASPGDYVEMQCWHDASGPIDLLVSGGIQSQMCVVFEGTN